MSANPARFLLRCALLAALIATVSGVVRAEDELPDSAFVRQFHPSDPGDPAAAPVPAPTPALDPGLQRDLQIADSLVAAQGGPTAGDSRLLLSWNAPWGQRRARQTHHMSCAADRSADTLYLALECGRESATFNGFLADLVFHSVGPDSLGPWWGFGKGDPNNGQVGCEFGPSETIPGEQPWRANGQGLVSWTSAGRTATLRMAYAVPYQRATPVHRRRIYTLGRVIFRHRLALPGCEQPVCVEWAFASLAFGLKDESRVEVGERFVSLQSDRSNACFELKRVARPWTPARTPPPTPR